MAERSVVRYPDFRVLWSGEVGARLAQQVTIFLLPLLAATVLHAGSTQVGLVSAAQTLPSLAFTLAAGAWAGRLPARALLGGANLLRALAMGGVGAFCAAQGLSLAVLLVAAAVIGSAAVFYDVAHQVAVPRYVEAGELVPANGLIQSTSSVAQLAGPAVAGFLLQLLAPALAAAVTALGFLTACLIFLRLRETPGGGTRPAPTRSALRFLWTCRPIRDLCLQSGLFNLHEQAFLTVFLLYGLRELHLPAAAVGLVIGLGSLGALAGSLLAGPLSRRAHLGATMVTAITAASLALLLVPVLGLMDTPAALLGVAFVVNGGALAVYNVHAISLRQRIPPADLLGPVTAVYRLAVFGTMPLGAMAGGLLADLAGFTTALWVITVSLVLSCLVLIFSPLRRTAL